MTSKTRSASRGITLVETMISLTIAGFGLLALVGMQLNFQRYADTSRLRTMATHLAQEKLELLRSAAQTHDDGNSAGWNDLASGEDSPAFSGSNTLARRWTVAGESSDGERVVSVTVAWRGEAVSGNPSSATLSTVLSHRDPVDGASLTLPVPGGILRHAHQRHPSIPFVATTVGGANRGRSTMAWGDRSHLVFDDLDGSVIARCGAAPDAQSDITQSCVATDAWILDGYINGVGLPESATVQFTGGPADASAQRNDCIVERNTKDRNGSYIAGVHRYRCLIGAGSRGALRFAGLPANINVCRYAVGTRDAIVERYTHASKPAEHQNYLLTTNPDCPADTAPYPGT